MKKRFRPMVIVNQSGKVLERFSNMKHLSLYFGSISTNRLAKYLEGVEVLTEEGERLLSEISRQPVPLPGQYKREGRNETKEVNDFLRQEQEKACQMTISGITLIR